MKFWVSHISFYKESLQYFGNLGQEYKKISGNWCYFECKGQILLIKDEKTQIYLFSSKSLK